MLDDIRRLMRDAQKEVEAMPAWMKDQEPRPGQTYKEWIQERATALRGQERSK